MLDAFNTFVGCITKIANMLFQLPLSANISVGSFWLACGILGAVITVVFSSVRAFNMIHDNNARMRRDAERRERSNENV